MNIRLLSVLLPALLLAACSSYGPRDYAYTSGYGYSRATCYDCGRVTRIERVYYDGRETSGGGAVLGAVVGGVLGNQIGSGSGRRAATAAGAIAGGIAGNRIERNRRYGTPHYEVHVRTDDGRNIVLLQRHLDGIRINDRVRISGDRVIALAYR